MTFTPIYLYIKQHSITGKLYFGKTYKDPITYSGSGKRWKAHLKVHGKDHVETLWYCLFHDQEELTKFAIMCSEHWDIVKSDDWLNFIPENGLDGGSPGSKLSSITREKISVKLKGKPKSIDHREKIAKSIKNLAPEIFEKIAASNRGRIHTDETRSNMSIAHKGKKKSDEASS